MRDTANPSPLIAAEGLTIRYGAKTVLRGVDFAIHPGEVVTFVGPNGSGKSSLIRALIGARPPDHGAVRAKPNLRIGYVPQRLGLLDTLPLTVERFLSLPRRQSPAAMAAALARTGAAGLEKTPVRALSGGQLQRVALARALMSDPEILVLDEPTQGLDQPGIAGFYDMIGEMRADLGCAVLMVSHDLHVVMRASDRVICLNGHICCQGAPMTVSASPEYRALFGEGTGGALALYRHHHDHVHDAPQEPSQAPSHVTQTGTADQA